MTALRTARYNAYNSAHSLPTVTVFSGDVFSPAPLTPHTKGEEMSAVLNASNIDVACIGNHDMDLGLEVMFERMSETNFPWLLTNAVFQKTKEEGFNSHGAEIRPWHVVQRGGLRIGFMGLIPEQWLDSLACVPVDEIDYTDFVQVSNETSAFLRDQQKCDFVIALTHMRQNDDMRLANEALDVDLILGGHDHNIDISTVNDRWIVKSGTDFRTFSCMDVASARDGSFNVRKPWIVEVTGDIRRDYSMHRLVKKYEHLFVDDDLVPIAYSNVPLDGRFCAIRSRETGLGNLFTDIMTEYMDAEIGLLNGGSFRSDMLHEEGEFLEKDLTTILPYLDNTVVLDITGKELLAALENSVSQYPALEGRFCQVSGVKFAFDPRLPGGSRIILERVKCRGRDGEWATLDEDRRYHVVVKTFMAEGKDGFDVFEGRTHPDVKKSGEGEDLTNLVRMRFEHMREDSAEHKAVIAPEPEGRITCDVPDKHLEDICGRGSE